jgi:hypothetical protein
VNEETSKLSYACEGANSRFKLLPSVQNNDETSILASSSIGSHSETGTEETVLPFQSILHDWKWLPQSFCNTKKMSNSPTLSEWRNEIKGLNCDVVDGSSLGAPPDSLLSDDSFWEGQEARTKCALGGTAWEECDCEEEHEVVCQDSKGKLQATGRSESFDNAKMTCQRLGQDLPIVKNPIDNLKLTRLRNKAWLNTTTIPCNLTALTERNGRCVKND